MPSKKKKYNARFPPARIKKIMQMDEEVGKVAATVPVIISRALELFIESLIQQATRMTVAKNARTLSSSHLKHIIESQERYGFLKELVANVSDHQVEEEGGANHRQEEEGSSSTVASKKTRGRPRKPKEANQVTQKKERRKRKKESSSSESENSEDTEEGDEGTDEESVPAASSAGVTTPVPSYTSSTENSGSSLSTEPLPAHTPTTSTTLTYPPPISKLLAQAQTLQQSALQHQEGAASVDSNLVQNQPQDLSMSAESTAPSVVSTTFQSTPTMMPAALPMYQGLPGAPTATAANLLAWPGPAGMLAGGFPAIPAQGFTGLQAPGVGFPGMVVPGLGFPAMSPSLMTFQGLPGLGFPGVSSLPPGFPGVTVASPGLPGLPSKAPPATVGTPNGAQGDDDYDT
ncbi:uncharacterized protein LOC143281066 [Babylonia areolata]|uniref:uncharacterized protein LOC143281066 n=1 Tax=Babylonia areolata TaxID=304850 RepID=UPI003FD24879